MKHEPGPIRIAVCADPPHDIGLQKRAAFIAESIDIPKTKIGQPDCECLLVVTPERLELRILEGESDLVGGHPVYADFEKVDTRSPAGRKLDMPLLKAVGIKKGVLNRPMVVDCTAGLGEDAWLLASHRCDVIAIERKKIIALLLDDAIHRATTPDHGPADRIRALGRNAIDWLNAVKKGIDEGGDFTADAIVLDPMFPLGRKAKERKPMRVLRMLAGDDDDAPELLAAALATGVHRVCVKRPLKAPVIANEKRPAPDVVYKGKAVRFDVYINP